MAADPAEQSSQKFDDLLKELSQKVKEQPLNTSVPVILGYALEATGENRLKILDLIPSIPIPASGNALAPARIGKDRYQLPSRTSGGRKVWLKLIESFEPIKQEDYRYIFAKTSGEYASILLEGLCYDLDISSISSSWNIWGDHPGVFLSQRARARLDEQKIPDFPDPKKIPVTRLRKIIDTISKTPDGDIDDYVKKLSKDEMAAWLEWSQYYDYPHISRVYTRMPPSIPISPECRRVRYRLLGVTDSYIASHLDSECSANIIKAINLKRYDVIDEKMLMSIGEFLAKNYSTYSGSVILLSQCRQNTGYQLWVHRSTPERNV